MDWCYIVVLFSRQQGTEKQERYSYRVTAIFARRPLMMRNVFTCITKYDKRK